MLRKSLFGGNNCHRMHLAYSGKPFYPYFPCPVVGLYDMCIHLSLFVRLWHHGCCSMDVMGSLAQRNAMLVHGLDWSERRAGIFEPAPTDDLAVATTLGLVLNCLSSGLYMVTPSLQA